MSTTRLHQTSGPEAKRAAKKEDCGKLCILGYRDRLTILKRVPKNTANLEGDWLTTEELDINKKQVYELASMLDALIQSKAAD